MAWQACGTSLRQRAGVYLSVARGLGQQKTDYADLYSARQTKVEVKGDNTGKIYGDLTIHGVTRQIVLDTEFLGENTNPWGAKVIGFNATTKINREDFGLTWNVALETGGVLVGKEIKIELDVEAALVVESVAANA